MQDQGIQIKVLDDLDGHIQIHHRLPFWISHEATRFLGHDLSRFLGQLTRKERLDRIRRKGIHVGLHVNRCIRVIGIDWTWSPVQYVMCQGEDISIYDVFMDAIATGHHRSGMM